MESMTFSQKFLEQDREVSIYVNESQGSQGNNLDEENSAQELIRRSSTQKKSYLDRLRFKNVIEEDEG